jgi:hypothetical protein
LAARFASRAATLLPSIVMPAMTGILPSTDLMKLSITAVCSSEVRKVPSPA